MNKLFWLVTGIITAFLLSDNNKTDNLLGIRKRRTKRLFYISDNKVIPKDQVSTVKIMARSGHGCIYATWAYSVDEARELIRQGLGESICKIGIGQLGQTKKPELFGAVVDPNQPYMQLSPISPELQRRFENTTFSPYDMNKEFNESVEAKEQETMNQLKKYRVSEMPEDIQTALAYYRKALYEFLVTKANQIPGPMITGPSKYNYQKLEKSLKREDKALESVDTAKDYLRKAVNRAIKGRKTTTQQESHDRWLEEALITPRREFANKVFQAAYDKANPNLQADYDAGVFVTAVKNKGKKLHAELIDQAIQQGLEIDTIVKQDYPEKFGLEKPKPDVRKQIARQKKQIEEFIKHQEESQRIADEASLPARQRIKEQLERFEQKEFERQKSKRKIMPEQTSFTEPSQMTLFGKLNDKQLKLLGQFQRKIEKCFSDDNQRSIKWQTEIR